MVVMTTILNITIEIINAIYCIKTLKNGSSHFKNFDFKLMREMTVFSSYIYLFNLVIDQI